MHRLSSLDAQFLAAEHGNSGSHYCGMAIYQTGDRVNDPIPVPIFGIAARGLMELISSRFVRPPVNLIISNVPGSPVPVACYGAPLVAHYPLSLVFDGFTLNITVVSYELGLGIGIVGDAETLPDAWCTRNPVNNHI